MEHQNSEIAPEVFSIQLGQRIDPAVLRILFGHWPGSFHIRRKGLGHISPLIRSQKRALKELAVSRNASI